MSAYREAVRHVARQLRDAGVGVPVCEGVVPSGTAYPCVLVQAYGDARDVNGMSQVRVLTQVDLVVRVVGDVSDREVDRVAASVDGALHKSASGPVVASERLAETVLIETEQDGGTWQYLGGIYRITATA